MLSRSLAWWTGWSASLLAACADCAGNFLSVLACTGESGLTEVFETHCLAGLLLPLLLSSRCSRNCSSSVSAFTIHRTRSSFVSRTNSLDVLILSSYLASTFLIASCFRFIYIMLKRIDKLLVKTTAASSACWLDNSPCTRFAISCPNSVHGIGGFISLKRLLSTAPKLPFIR